MDLALVVGTAVASLAVMALVVWRRPVFVFAQRAFTFSEHVRTEVRKVTWPSWDDLRRSTLVISIIVILIGILIGIMDWVFSRLLIDFLGRAIG